MLVPGFWLGAWAWDEVVERLPTDELAVHAVSPRGLDGMPEAEVGAITLDDQIDHVVALVDRLVDGGAGTVVVVGHSGAGPVVQGAVDSRPHLIDRVIYVDTGPLLNGVSMATVTVEPPADAEIIPLPEWSSWQEAENALDGLDAAMLNEFRDRAVPEPAGVARSVVKVVNNARLEVPATVICTSIPSAQLRELVAAGHIPSEIHNVVDVTWIDLPTGHWPMFSRPGALAAIIADQARS